MQRRFDITAYSALALHQFDSVDDFLATPPRDGISEIMIGERPLHALFRSRGADTTLVHFSAALARGKGETYPQFGGAALSGSLPVNWLALSDPNYSLPQAPATGWFLGSRTQPLVRSMSSIVRHFSSAGIEEQAILFGSSAGGFAALNYGAQLPGSVTLCLNPRTDLMRLPSQLPVLSRESFPGVALADFSELVALSAADAYRSNQGNTVAYVQNVQDSVYFEGGLLHFLAWNSDDERVRLKLIDSGPGHVLPEREVYEGAVRELVRSAPDWHRALDRLDYLRGPTSGEALAGRTELLAHNGATIH